MLRILRIKIFANIFKVIFKLLPKDSPEYRYLNQAGCNIVTHHHCNKTKDYFSN
jgi:hypothetical protein